MLITKFKIEYVPLTGRMFYKYVVSGFQGRTVWSIHRRSICKVLQINYATYRNDDTACSKRIHCTACLFVLDTLQYKCADEAKCIHLRSPAQTLTRHTYLSTKP